MRHTTDLEQGNSSSPGRANRFALLFLAALFTLVVVLYLSRAGEIPLFYTRLLFTLSASVYMAALLLRQREEGWSWSGRAEAWRATKDCAASAVSYCRRNYKRVTYYVVIFLYGSALLFSDTRYVVVVSLLEPALIAVAKVSGDSRGDRASGSRQQIPRKGWSWSGRAEAWRATKDCAASAVSYCRRNYKRVTYYVVIFLYGSALLFSDTRYVVVVSLLAPALIAVAKVSGDSRGDRASGSRQQIPQLSAVVGVAAEQRAEEFIS